MGKTTWERTPVQNLLRNGESGRYFGRWTVGGKQIWLKLDTDVFSVAKMRLTKEAAKIEARRNTAAAVAGGEGLMRDYLQLYENRTKANTDLKPSSITARLVALKKIRKTWPTLEGMRPNVSPEAVQEWARRFKANGTGFTPPGAKTTIKGNSATSVNRAIDSLRRVFDLAVAAGAIHSNPVKVAPTDGSKLKKKIAKTQPEDLPRISTADMQRLLSAMESNGARGGWGIEAADFCRFMYFSGCRVGEVPGVTWECIDWENKRLRVRGIEQQDSDHGALKTESSTRTLPLFSELEKLLRRIIERRKAAAKYAIDGKPMIAPTDPVFRLRECQKTIDAASSSTGVPRLTHHDFRHLFATRCIEAGVDIPTVSRWLGHADGGALAMKTYGHLRDEHSQTMAAKVSFGGAA